MLKSIRLGKEISFSVANKIGILADVSKILSEYNINILAVAGYAASDNTAKIMLVCEDTSKADSALNNAGYKSLGENEIVVAELENKPGALKSITEKMVNAGIDIKYVYGTTCSGPCAAKIILSTSDNQKTLAVLNK